MKQYLDSVSDIMNFGTDGDDRTGVGTRSLFGVTTRYNLKEGFPAVTTKKLAWKPVVSELLWFLEGDTDERRLAEILYKADRKDLVGRNTIWTQNADNQGVDLGYENSDTVKQLGPIYGGQWRNSGKIDQIDELVENIKKTPNSRRHILSAWNTSEIKSMSLPPCHTMAQFQVSNGSLSCLMFQRSGDMFLGVPFNVASYSLLTHMIANHCDLMVGDFVHVIGVAHIYKNHFDQVKKQLNRKPTTKPQLVMPDIESFDIDFIKTLSVDDFKLEGYEPQSTIKAEMAV